MDFEIYKDDFKGTHPSQSQSFYDSLNIEFLKNSFKGNNCMIGSIVHSVSISQLELLENSIIVFNDEGVIILVLDLDRLPESMKPLPQSIYSEFKKVYDYKDRLILPGFVDAHCHAPQYVFSGTGMDLPLLEWLEKYTFPCEARFSDAQFARIAYEKSIRRHLKCGTTFASYFATIHNESGKILADIIKKVGQRAYVGKVSMDRNSPDFYVEETSKACEDAEEFARYVLGLTHTGREFLSEIDGHFSSNNGNSAKRSKFDQSITSISDSKLPSSSSEVHSQSLPSMVGRPRTISMTSATENDSVSFQTQEEYSISGIKRKPLNSHKYHQMTLLNRHDTPLVMPCVTPRFVPTCTSQLMARLGDISLKYGLPVQSHMSESVNEIDWVSELHPESEHYAHVYEQHDLLHERAFMAHCCHSSRGERIILKRNNAGVVHCASSNFMLNSGVMDLRIFINEGIKVGVGTDVAGGYSPSMLDALRQTVIASRAKGFGYKYHGKPLTDKDASLSINDDSYSDWSSSEKNEKINEKSSSSDLPMITPREDATPEDSNSLDLNDHIRNYNNISYVEAFYLCTVGGAEVLGMGEILGNFVPGKKLDCLIVDVNAHDTPIDTFEHETPFEHFQKFIFLGDDRNIEHVFVNGKRVL